MGKDPRCHIFAMIFTCAGEGKNTTPRIAQIPRRHPAASYHDLALSTGTILLLNLVSPLLIMEDDTSSALLAVLLVCLVISLPVITVIALVWILMRLLRKNAGFTIFLSHHKAAAGALCRLLTVVLQEHERPGRAFLSVRSNLTMMDTPTPLRCRRDTNSTSSGLTHFAVIFLNF